MRWIVASLVLALAGCGGLARHSYPVPAADPVMVGEVVHAQPYRGATSESGWSRFGWGALAGGIAAGAAAGLADADLGEFQAYSYVVAQVEGKRHVVNAYAEARPGDCVAVYDAAAQGMHSLAALPPERCQH